MQNGEGIKAYYHLSILKYICMLLVNDIFQIILIFYRHLAIKRSRVMLIFSAIKSTHVEIP